MTSTPSSGELTRQLAGYAAQIPARSPGGSKPPSRS